MAEFRSAHKAPMQCEVSASSPNEDIKKYFTNLTHWILNYTNDCTKAHKAMMTRGFALKHLELWWLRETKVWCIKVWISLHKNFSWNGPFLWKAWACISYYLALISTYIYVEYMEYMDLEATRDGTSRQPARTLRQAAMIRVGCLEVLLRVASRSHRGLPLGPIAGCL